MSRPKSKDSASEPEFWRVGSDPLSLLSRTRAQKQNPWTWAARNRGTGRWELTERVVVSGHLCTSRVLGRWAGGLGLELERAGEGARACLGLEGWRAGGLGRGRNGGQLAGGLEGWRSGCWWVWRVFGMPKLRNTGNTYTAKYRIRIGIDRTARLQPCLIFKSHEVRNNCNTFI